MFVLKNNKGFYLTAKMTSEYQVALKTGNINFAYVFQSEKEAENWHNSLNFIPEGFYPEKIK